jgi:hypothetical protein
MQFATALRAYAQPGRFSGGDRGNLLPLCVGPEPTEVDLNARLIARYLSVVTRRDVEHISSTDLQRGSVIHMDRHGAGDAIAVVVSLAGVGLGDRLHVLRPLPARLEDAPSDDLVTEVDYLGLSPALKGSSLVRGIEGEPIVEVLQASSSVGRSSGLLIR